MSTRSRRSTNSSNSSGSSRAALLENVVDNVDNVPGSGNGKTGRQSRPTGSSSSRPTGSSSSRPTGPSSSRPAGESRSRSNSNGGGVKGSRSASTSSSNSSRRRRSTASQGPARSALSGEKDGLLRDPESSLPPLLSLDGRANDSDDIAHQYHSMQSPVAASAHNTFATAINRTVATVANGADSAVSAISAIGALGANDGAQVNLNDEDGSYDDDDEDDDRNGGTDEDTSEMSIEELLYSSSSYYAIARPVTITMVLAALLVVFVNTEDTLASGQAMMSSAYQVWDINGSSTSQSLILSLANALVMVSVICCMTFVIVLLYKFKCMKFLIGYMVLTSSMLLGVMGSNVFSTFVTIYNIPVDKITFYGFMANFAVVGVLAVFWGQGIPKYITQAYLIATAVILSWHLSYFDEWTTWTLLFMLALYDLCAVLTPCGPLKALVNLMSEDDAPEMPGLLFEAELPAEARKPTASTPGGRTQRRPSESTAAATSAAGTTSSSVGGARDVPPLPPFTPSSNRSNSGVAVASGETTPNTVRGSANYVAAEAPGKLLKLPLAIAKVYQLPVVAIPESSTCLRNLDQTLSESPLLPSIVQPNLMVDVNITNDTDYGRIVLPQNPTPDQLRAMVMVQLPATGGRLEQVSKRGKRVYLERDRYGTPKRLLWVDKAGKVYAEMREDDDDMEQEHQRNTIRLGLGDFIFYSVLVSKAAQYSFSTFAVCMLVILAGLGGTLVLLSVYHHALPALPISIFLGVIFYLMTRFAIEPWIEQILYKPYYV